MAADAEEDSLARLKEIYSKISNHIDVILQCTKHFQAEYFTKLSPETLSDISKVRESCLRLKQEISAFKGKEKELIGLQHVKLQEFLSKVRHDLRNPMNAIQGYSEMILEALQQQPSLLSKYNEVVTAIPQIVALIDNIKLFSSPPIQPQIQAAVTDQDVSRIDLKNEEFRHFRDKFAILIVDDNEENCRLLERYLHHLGLTNTQIAHDGFQALAMANRSDLILLDIDMPGMSGIDVLTRLKDYITQNRLMVLMISAADTLENTIECIKLGAEDFLPKPFNIDLLHVRINSCIEKKWAIFQQNLYLERLTFERQRYEKLLKAVFPLKIVEELTKSGKIQPSFYNNVAILFADIVGFTTFCDNHEPDIIFSYLQEFSEACETIALKNKVQKIKTIGDCFLGVSGLLTISENPVLDCVNFAEQLIINSSVSTSKWPFRIGIHYGTVIGGIVGHRQYLFDIWGDAVNTASRVQNLAQSNTIYLSKTAWEQVQHICRGKSLGEVKVKGKEPFEVFVYEGQ